MKNGRITHIGPQHAAVAAADTIDRRPAGPARLRRWPHPPDKSFVGDRWRPHQNVATLRERLAVEKRELASAPPILDRADALIRQAATYGTLAMRCHVDVDATTGLSHLNAILQARDNWKDLIDIELVAFPQAGVVSCPGTAEIRKLPCVRVCKWSAASTRRRWTAMPKHSWT